MSIVKSDLIEAISPLQLCAGLEAGCEAAVHFISQSYDSDSSQGALFVDASNAFNNLSRLATLVNTHSICACEIPIVSLLHSMWMAVACGLRKEQLKGTP